MHSHFDIHRKCALVVLLVSLPAPLAAQMGLGLTPMRVEFPAEAGRSYSGSLKVSNSSAAKARVRAEILDFYVDPHSTPQFVDSAPSEEAFSCRSWVTVNPMDFELEPRSPASVRYTVRVPSTASERGYHCAIGFRSLPAVVETGGIGIHTAVRVVSVLYPLVGKPPVAAEIADVKLEPAQGGSANGWRGVVVMQNAGMVLYRPQGEFEVFDSTGTLIESHKLVSFPVLPLRQQRFVIPLNNGLPRGRYTLRARVDVGSEIQEASAAVTVEP